MALVALSRAFSASRSSAGAAAATRDAATAGAMGAAPFRTGCGTGFTGGGFTAERAGCGADIATDVVAGCDATGCDATGDAAGCDATVCDATGCDATGCAAAGSGVATATGL